MFYGPLAAPTTPGMPLLMGSSFAADMGNVVSAAEGQPSHKGESAAASRAASAMSNHGSGAGPQANNSNNSAEEEEYDEEEYEEEEYEEEDTVDNLSHGSSSLTSSMEERQQQQQHLHHSHHGAGISSSARHPGTANEVPQPPQFHHPFGGGVSSADNGAAGKRRFAPLKTKNLGQKTVQAGQEQQQQQQMQDGREELALKLELAAAGLQMVRVPDCEPKAFAILIDFVYSDFDVHNLSSRLLLNDENVMNCLYAAKKYDIRPLVAECVRYCTARLTAINAASLLAQARLLDENTLVEQCLQVIDQNTDVALQASNVADIDRDTLIDVLGRNQLDPSSELVVFYAAKAWGEAECARRGIHPSVENLRQCLGPAMQLIRFSLMDVNEFGQAASSSLLTYEEIAEVFLHLTVKPRPPIRSFAAQGFRANSRSKHVVQRFLSVSAKPRSRREHKVCFTTDRDVLVSGLSVYGVFQANNKVYDENPKTLWEHDVEIKLEASTDSPSIYGSALKLLASNIVQLGGKFGDPTPVAAYFTEPVACQANITYLATVHFKNETGVSTFQGKDGQDLVTVELPCDEAITFKFHSYRYGFDGGDGGRAEGQIPAIHFLIQWPEKPATREPVVL